MGLNHPSMLEDPEDLILSIAGRIFHSLLLFIILQVPLWLPPAILLLLLPGIDVLDEQTAEWLGGLVWILEEVTLFCILTWRARGQIRSEIDVYREQLVSSPQPSLRRGLVSTPNIEIALVATAIITAAYCLLTGMDSFAARIAFFVVEAFAGLFVSVFVATRWFVVQRVSLREVVGLLLIALSISSGLE